MFPGCTRLSIPNCISICSAVFTQLTTESQHFTMYINNTLTRDLKINTAINAIWKINHLTALIIMQFTSFASFARNHRNLEVSRCHRCAWNCSCVSWLMFELCRCQITVADLGAVLTKDQQMFPDNPDIWLKDLASFINLQLANCYVPVSDTVFEGKPHGAFSVCWLLLKLLQSLTVDVWLQLYE